MAYTIKELVATLGVIVLSWFVWSRIAEGARRRRLARQYDCEPIPQYRNRDPILGYDLYRIFKKADEDGRRSKAYQAIHQEYGLTFEMKALGPLWLQTAHPENIQAICATKFDNFGVEPMRGDIGAPFMDRGIFMVDGEHWKRSRGLIRPIFNRAEIADLDNFGTYVSQLIDLLPKDGSSFDMLPLAKRLFNDTASEFIFGESIHSLRPEMPEDMSQFMSAFDRGLQGLAATLILGPFKFLVYRDPSWIKAYKTVHAFVDRRVNVAIERQKKLQQEGTTGDAPTKYIVANEMALLIQDPYLLRHELINIFFPARDTAAIAFSNIVFYMARYPKWWTLIRKEVLDLGDQHLHFELVRSLKTVRAVINEVIRLHPASSRIGRVALEDTVLPKGGGPTGESPIFVPKGRVVEMNLYVVQRDPKHWGPDAEEFKPERWAEGRPLWETKWQYEPFLGGIRMCPAHNQVITQLCYLIVRFAKEFERIENRDEVFEYKERVAMTVESMNGAKIALYRTGKS